MTIIETALPDSSLLNRDNKKYDYVDSFEGLVVDKGNQLKSTDLGKAFFSAAPKWIDKLFELRNRFAGMAGLKTYGAFDTQQILDNFKGEPGEQVGLFKVFDKSDNEIILGEDDKHLNFRVSLFLHNLKEGKTEKQLTISTTVVFNNWLGRLYFLPVRPFHKLVVPAMLKGLIKQLETPT